MNAGGLNAPVIGALPIDEVTLEHTEQVMASLLDHLELATRRQLAQGISRVLRLAAYPLRAIARSPTPKGFVPPRRSTKTFSYLYPDEDATLLACDAVPVGCRLLYGFLSREGMRESEARGLTWADLGLGRGTVTLDENKTDDPRAWVLSAGVGEALAAWWRMLGEPELDEVVVGPEAEFDWHHPARTLRRHLRAAGVRRPELFTKITGATTGRCPLNPPLDGPPYVAYMPKNTKQKPGWRNWHTQAT